MAIALVYMQAVSECFGVCASVCSMASTKMSHNLLGDGDGGLLLACYSKNVRVRFVETEQCGRLIVPPQTEYAICQTGVRALVVG